MKNKILSLAIICSMLAPAGAAPNPAALWGDTWANWETRLSRAYDSLEPHRVPGRVMGVIVPPDLGNDETLPMNGLGYQLLDRGGFETAILLFQAPAGSTLDGIAVPNLKEIETPFGLFHVDASLANELVARNTLVVPDNSMLETNTRALHTQLAALKYALGRQSSILKVLPMYVKFSDPNTRVKDLAPYVSDVIRNMGLTERVVFMVPCSLTQAPSRPDLLAADAETLKSIKNLSVETILENHDKMAQQKLAMPDMDAFLMGLLTLRWLGADHGEVLAYGHTGQLVLTKDRSTLTSFATAGLVSGAPFPIKIAHKKQERMKQIFDELFRADLLAMTRQACAAVVDTTAAKPPALINPQAGKKWPVYVSVYAPDGKLLGQAGSHAATGPLEESIRQYAFDAVSKAGSAITKADFAKDVVDVSIPYGFTDVNLPEELIPLLNGVIVTHDHRTASVHPDAWRNFPDVHELLGALSEKLGLAPWAYATRQARVQSFRIFSFNEKEPFQDLDATGKRKKKRKGDNTEDAPAEESGGGSSSGGGGMFSF